MVWKLVKCQRVRKDSALRVCASALVLIVVVIVVVIGISSEKWGVNGECWAWACNGGLVVESPVASRDRAPGQRGWNSPQKLKAFCLSKVQMRHKFVHFCNPVNWKNTVAFLFGYYTSAHGSGRRYYILLLKFLSFFLLFSFAKGSPRWLYRQGTFLAQMVGYGCNFKNWVQNLGGDPPLKFGGPQTPNAVTQSRGTRSKLILGIGRENEYPKPVSKFWGIPPPKKFVWGSKFRNFNIQTGLAQGSRVTLTSNFYKW